MSNVIQFPIIPRKEAYIDWYTRVGSLEEIQEYKEFLNKATAHKVVKLDIKK